jgi:hypothetical protein
MDMFGHYAALDQDEGEMALPISPTKSTTRDIPVAKHVPMAITHTPTKSKSLVPAPIKPAQPVFQSQADIQAARKANTTPKKTAGSPKNASKKTSSPQKVARVDLAAQILLEASKKQSILAKERAARAEEARRKRAEEVEEDDEDDDSLGELESLFA